MTRKLRGTAGASIIMALGILMVVAALSASMLSISITTQQTAIKQQQEQQAYLAVTSAARLLKKSFKAAADSDSIEGPKVNVMKSKLVNPNDVVILKSSNTSIPDVTVTLISTSPSFQVKIKATKGASSYELTTTLSTSSP